MARSASKNYGLLGVWPEVMHEDVWRFNQILGQGVRAAAGCSNTPYLQYQRDNIARALGQAVYLTAEYLGYWPMPVYIANEEITISSSLQWDRQTLATRYGHLQSFGRRATTVIQAGSSVTFSDEDGDMIEETATISVTTTVDVSEIQVFFRTTDSGATGAADERWRVEPLTISASGGTVTITGHRSQFVHPKEVWRTEYIDRQPHAGDTGDGDDFVTAVDVYRVYTVSTDAVQLLLNPADVGAGNTPISATAVITNAELGTFTLYTDTGQTLPAGVPYAVRVDYLSGLALTDGRMDSEFEPAICRFANTYLQELPPCCDTGMAMVNDDRATPENLTARDTWSPSPFGISKAGLRLAALVRARQLATKARREPHI